MRGANHAGFEPVARPADATGSIPHTLIVLVFFAAALAVRVYNLGALSLWVDEGATLTFALAPWTYLWGPIAVVETNPPGYYSVMKLWISAFGSSDAALRMPSAIAGAVCVIPLYAIALRQQGRAAAIIATSFFVVSAIQVQYSQEARSFAIISLLFLLGLVAAGRIVTDIEARKGRFSGLALLAVCCGALPHMHFTGFFAAAVVFVYLFTLLWLKALIDLRVLRDLILVGCAVIVLSAPVLYWTVLHLNAEKSPIDWIKQRSAKQSFDVYRGVFGHRYLSAPTEQSDGFVAWLATPRRVADSLLFLTGVVAVVQALRTRQPHIIALLVALAFLMASFFLVSQIKPILISRVVVFGTPMVFLIAAFALTSLRSKWLVVVPTAALLAFQAVNLVQYYRTFEKERWRELIATTRDAHVPGTAIVMIGAGPWMLVLLDHYWGGHGPEDAFIVPGNARALHDVVIALRPKVVDVDPGAICETLRDFDAVTVLARKHETYQEALEALADGFRDRGATLRDNPHFGNIEIQRWTGLSCHRAQDRTH